MIVLDSSALLAVILEEPGADRVVETFSEATISAATLTEILSKARQRGLSTDGSYRQIVKFGIAVAPVTTLHARIAAEISRAPRELDLSLGDRLCIALAMSLDCGLVTSDRGIAGFDTGIPITMFR